MDPSNDSLILRVATSFKKLSAASAQLNAVSDDLGKLVAQLESDLKMLNLGIEAWVPINGGSDSNFAYWSDDLGYAKVDGRWGIALRSVSGDERSEAYGSYDAKLFNEAPRDKRAAAIDKIPDLHERLYALTEATTKRISGSKIKVQQIVTAVSAAVPRK